MAVLVGLGAWDRRPFALGELAPVRVGATAAWFAVAIAARVAWHHARPAAGGGRPAAAERWRLGWVVLVTAGYLIGAPFPAARFLIFLLPPVAAGLVVGIGRRLAPRPAAVVLALTVAGNVWLSVSLAAADDAFARFAAVAARRGALAAGTARARLLTTGHWGLQHHVEAAGGAALDRGRDRDARGVMVLEPAETDHAPLPRPLADRLIEAGAWRAPVAGLLRWLPVRAVWRAGAASFHGGHVWLPYALAGGPPESVRLLVERPAGSP
jgi:hypothetical protein